MERIDLAGKLKEILAKYKYVLLILCVGILLMRFPARNATDDVYLETMIVTDTPVSRAEELEEILGEIAGVGKIKVLLTEADGAQTNYQTDEDFSRTQDRENHQLETVIITDSGREEAGLIRSITPPIYLGAIVVCQGGDIPSIKLSIVQAVSNVTGISSDRITVLKMK